MAATLISVIPWCHGQVPANLLPVVGQSGEFVRTFPADTKIVSVTETGLVLECSQNASPGRQAITWRERYAVRDGHLVLDAVLTPHPVPPQPAHYEWQVSPAIGTSNIGPTGVDSHWGNYRLYLQRLIESTQREWDRVLAEGTVCPKSGSAVSVRFALDSKGNVTRIVGVNPSRGMPDIGIRACISAITTQAPYGDWTDDMVANLGTEQELTLSFYYQ